MSTSPFPTADDTQLITMLQNVHNHLADELQHLTALVERKTIQIQGIQSILEDTKTPGSTAPLEPETSVPVAPGTSFSQPEPVSASTAPGTAGWATDTTPPKAAQKQSTPSAKTKPNAASTATTPPPRQPKAAQKSIPAQTTGSKSPVSKPKLSASKLKSPAQPAQLRQALQPQFQDKTLAAAVGAVLTYASEPLTAKDVATELYEGLTIDDLKRATKTIATILASGRAKGNWQSPAKGLYQARRTEGRSDLVTAALSGAA